MTKGALLIGLGVVALGATTIIFNPSSISEDRAYVPRTDELATRNARGIQGAWDYYNMLRANVNTGQVEVEDILNMRKAVRAKAAASTTKAVGLQWIEMGPDNVGGRTRAIAINPNNANEIWAGGVSGGLWKSDNAGNQWQLVTGFAQGLNTNAADDNVNVASIAFAGNGDILVGTGSQHDGSGGTGGSGFLGGGLYRSQDGGATFDLLEGPSSPFVASSAYVTVDEVWADPNDPNKAYVGHSRGLDYWDLSAGTFTEVTNGLPNNLNCGAMAMSLDGQVMLVVLGNDPYLSTDGGANFSNISNSVGPGVGSGRTEVAISPDNPDYMYVLSATPNGAMRGVYGSSDRGQNWNGIWPSPVPAALDIFGDNTQGNYDNVIAVVPGSPGEFWVGGVTLWKGSITGQPVQAAQGASFPGCFNCVHVDVHAITWDLQNNIAYVGCDGGVYTGFSAGGNDVFVASNRGYNVTQFYAVAFDGQGRVMGGTQDNSTPYITLGNPNSIQEAVVLFGGDGFDCDISNIDPNIMFATSQNGPLGRSADQGANFAGIYNSRIENLANADGDIGDFYTNIRLWETYDDQNSPNTTTFDNIGGDTILPGDKFEYRGRNVSIPLYGFATDTIFPDSLVVDLPDPVQSMLGVGFSGAAGVWVTRDALAINEPTDWFQVATLLGNVNTLEFSKDGCNMYVGTSNGDAFAISGLCNAYDSIAMDITAIPENGSVLDSLNVGQTWLINETTGDTIKTNQSNLDFSSANFRYVHDSSAVGYKLYVRQIYNGGVPVTGIGVDPNDPNHVLLSFGGYGGSGKVRESNNALAPNPTFGNVWNPGPGLQGMPVYDVMIHVEDPNIFIAGTEWGVFATDNGGSTWEMENDGGTFVPVFAVRQQTNNWNTPHWYGADWYENYGAIYIGTHGRGIWRTETLLSVEDQVNSTPSDVIRDLTIFPNPSVNNASVIVNLKERSQVMIAMYDLNGRFVREISNGFLSAGERQVQFDVADLPNGTYILQLTAGNDVQVGRFIVQH